MSAAILVANPHNSQAWVFRSTPSRIGVFAAHGTGRRYIERGLSRMDELRAIVAICERVVDPASEETR